MNKNEITHADIDGIIERFKLATNTGESYISMLNELKPYIDLGICKVRFTSIDASPSMVSELMDDMEKEGWCPIVGYQIYRYPHLRFGIFKTVSMMLVYKKLVDVKTAQLLEGLKTSEVIQLN